jgi:acyl-coenzyme A thioesterase PaaI-like protein
LLRISFVGLGFKGKLGVRSMDLTADDSMCFVCGQRNPIGLRIKFDVDSENLRIRGSFVPRSEHQGYAGIMHGGLVCALLDEAMVKVLWESGITAVSAWLEVRLAKPVPLDEQVIIKGWVTSRRGKVYSMAARLENNAGTVLAEAEGKCVKVSPKEGQGAAQG